MQHDHTFTTEELLLFWGKTDRDNPGSTRYHPLLFHLLDVGSVAIALWDHGLHTTLKSRICTLLGAAEPQARRFIGLLAGQHDIGKASAFQAKYPTLWERLQRIPGSPRPDKDRPHALVSTVMLPSCVDSGAAGWTADSLRLEGFARIVGGHHGIFPSLYDLRVKPPGSGCLGQGEWTEHRLLITRLLKEHLTGDPKTVELTEMNDPAEVVPIIGGIICVADWIASASQYFPLSDGADITTYAITSPERAKSAVHRTGWTQAIRYAPPADFSTMFKSTDGGEFKPNPLQQAMIKAVEEDAGPALYIVEAAMGEGKTEAAFYAMDRALTTSGAAGAYVAMPTMATGNAMFKRLCRDYLKARGHKGRINIQLVHGGSFLSKDLDSLRLAANTPQSADMDTMLVAEEWFTPKKQALLAPFGVGTVDQALLGVLQTKHWFVRLFGLAGKVVIFDEVHAYDVYMSSILCSLLSWLKALGSTVIVLSATLPDSRRKDMVVAWSVELPIEPCSYPRITTAGGSTTATCVKVDGSARPPLDVTIARIGCSFEDAAKRLDADLPKGGCAVLICNTVTRVQEAHAVLTAALKKSGWRVSLFHARTLASWRSKTEAEVLRKFGKKGRRPKKALLIATQVVEQSLDLDFDWMASEAAPIDLLLQRMGRLWRHERMRPCGHPTFAVICDEAENGLPVFPQYTDYVYDEDILIRTMDTLRNERLAAEKIGDGKGVLYLPACIDRLVQTVYSDDTSPATEELWRDAICAAKDKLEPKRDRHRNLAEQVSQPSPLRGIEVVLSPGSTADKSQRNLEDSDDPETHPDVRAATRLGRPPIPVVCCGEDRDGKSLAALADAALTRPQIIEYLQHTVNISSNRLRQALLAIDTPAQWRQSRYLRHHRCLVFTDGQCTLGNYTLGLSQAVGLRIAITVN